MPFDTENHNPTMEQSRRLWNEATEIIWKGGPEAKQHDRLGDFGFPDFAARGSGCRFWDLDGNEYVDYLMGWGTVLLGHGYNGVNEAVVRNLQEGSLFNLSHESEVSLARRLVKIIPGAEKIRFLISGSEATSAAIRIAREATGRNKVIKYGFHGWLEWNQDDHPAGILPCVTDNLLNLEYNNLDHLKELFVQNPGKVACVIMEAVKDELPKPGFLQGVRDLAHENGSLLVFDEIKTGFRLGLGGAQEYFKVKADICVFSKAISNGFPLAVLTGRAELLARVERVWVNGTYHGWLPSITAAHTVLDVIEREPVFVKVWRLGAQLMDGFNRIMQANDLQARLKGLPPMPRPRFPEGEKVLMQRFFSFMVKKGYYMHPNHAWFLSYSHDEGVIDDTLKAVEESARETRK